MSPSNHLFQFLLLTLQVFLEVWGEGSDWEELFESIRAYPAHLKSPYEGEDQVRESDSLA